MENFDVLISVSRRSCLEVPVAGPLINFLQELGFEQDFTYVAEGHMFVRGRVKALVYTINEVVQFHSPSNADPTACVDFSGMVSLNFGGIGGHQVMQALVSFVLSEP
ncbi:unnamed protein product [Echinostoma caproni]|uniref:Mediator of RNA polymerase II transcription subunit 18 n=1 Tax=Echinostoma caproni TaxID=27848 RepID=A0A183BC20_9TREM|nr:unnamed protein product [Echinostoma caproni]